MTEECGPAPEAKDGTRICIAVTHQGVTAYCNKAACESLAAFFQWLAQSPEGEYHELHTLMHLQDEETRFAGKEIKNVYALFDGKTRAAFDPASFDEEKGEGTFGFEQTFMRVTEADLDKMDALQNKGPLPDNWHSAGEDD